MLTYLILKYFRGFCKKVFTVTKGNLFFHNIFTNEFITNQIPKVLHTSSFGLPGIFA